MSIAVMPITPEQASRAINVAESQFAEAKAKEVSPAKLTKTISAFANSDGGELYIGVSEVGPDKVRQWRGFIPDYAWGCA